MTTTELRQLGRDFIADLLTPEDEETVVGVKKTVLWKGFEIAVETPKGQMRTFHKLRTLRDVQFPAKPGNGVPASHSVVRDTNADNSPTFLAKGFVLLGVSVPVAEESLPVAFSVKLESNHLLDVCKVDVVPADRKVEFDRDTKSVKLLHESLLDGITNLPLLGLGNVLIPAIRALGQGTHLVAFPTEAVLHRGNRASKSLGDLGCAEAFLVKAIHLFGGDAELLHGPSIIQDHENGRFKMTGDWVFSQTAKSKSPADYGFLVMSRVGADGEHMDVFLGPDKASDIVFVVDQVHPETGDFDEHKALLGCTNIDQAEALYLDAYDDYGPDRLGAITPMTVHQFRDWLTTGELTESLRYAAEDWVEEPAPRAKLKKRWRNTKTGKTKYTPPGGKGKQKADEPKPADKTTPAKPEPAAHAEPAGDAHWGSKDQPYWRPGANPTVDNILTRDNPQTGEKEILLIQRGPKGAEAGKWALPGGFHDTDAKEGEAWRPGKETAEEAALRELAEETGLDGSSLKGSMKPVGTYEGNKRDPRDNDEAWSKSSAFAVHLSPEQAKQMANVQGMDDASAAKWVPVSKLGEHQLAFDHGKILGDAGVGGRGGSIKPPAGGWNSISHEELQTKVAPEIAKKITSQGLQSLSDEELSFLLPDQNGRIRALTQQVKVDGYDRSLEELAQSLMTRAAKKSGKLDLTVEDLRATIGGSSPTAKPEPKKLLGDFMAAAVKTGAITMDDAKRGGQIPTQKKFYPGLEGQLPALVAAGLVNVETYKDRGQDPTPAARELNLSYNGEPIASLRLNEDPGGTARTAGGAAAQDAGKGWLSGAGQSQENIHAAMRDIDRMAQAAMERGRKLRPPQGTIGIGGADFDEELKGQSLEAFLRAVRNGKTPDEAMAAAKDEARAMIQNWNTKGVKGRAGASSKEEMRRWEVSIDSALEDAHRRLLRSAVPEKSDDVASQARGLASGTLAGLTGLNKSADIDKVQAAFMQHVEANKGKGYETWQDAWNDFQQSRGADKARPDSFLGKPAEPAFQRTTPPKAERESIKAQAKQLDEEVSKLDQDIAVLNKKIRSTYDPKREEKFEQQKAKLIAKKEKAMAARDPLNKQMVKGHLEDLIESGDEAQKISARVKMLTDEHGSQNQEARNAIRDSFNQIKELGKAEAIKQGATPEEAELIAGSAASMISSYPSFSTLEQRIAGEMSGRKRQTARNNAWDEARTERELNQRRMTFNSDLASTPVRPMQDASVISQIMKSTKGRKFLGLAQQAGIATDGHWMFRIPEADQPKYRRAGNGEDPGGFRKTVEDMMAKADTEQQPAKVSGVRVSDTKGEPPLYLLESPTGRKVAVNAQFLETIRKRYPNATMHLTNTTRSKDAGAKPLFFKDGGKVVGAVMPIEGFHDATVEGAAPGSPTSDLASRASKLYESAVSTDLKDIEAFGTELAKVPKDQLVAAAEAIELKGMQHKSRAEIAKQITQRIVGRKGASQRAALIGPSKHSELASGPLEG